MVVGMRLWKALGLPTNGALALANWLGHLGKAKIRMVIEHKGHLSLLHITFLQIIIFRLSSDLLTEI